jgi:hypothetical protein
MDGGIAAATGGLTASVPAWLTLTVGSLVLFVPWVTYTTQRRLDAQRFSRDRRAETYVRLIRMLHHSLARVEEVHPFLSYANRPPTPEITKEQEWEMAAEVAAFGSREVQHALDAYQQELREFSMHALDVTANNDPKSRATADDARAARRSLEDSRRSLRTQVDKIKDLVWFELHRRPETVRERAEIASVLARLAARRLWDIRPGRARRQRTFDTQTKEPYQLLAKVSRSANDAKAAGSTSVARGDSEPGDDESAGR